MYDAPEQRAPNFHISFRNCEALIGAGMWSIIEVPPDRWAAVKDHLGKTETLAVFASGVAPRASPRVEAHIAGIDRVKLEHHPKPGEPPLNVYHYGIGRPDGHSYPVFGPIRNGSTAPHWSDLDDLAVYTDFDQPVGERAGPATGCGSEAEGGPDATARLP
ncbi:MAG: hypothetical protein FJ294_09515 [Planctomycetes bacterium]|nr:hypothetical protein [Planctomycetota bacterium]